MAIFYFYLNSLFIITVIIACPKKQLNLAEHTEE